MPDNSTNFPKLSRIGRFEILSELGKGAMGVVYLAKDPSIGRLVAIKTIRVAEAGEDDSESREFRQRFMREAQTAGILSHPNIVTIYDVGEDGGSGISFIAMEYIEGKTLKTMLAEKAPFSPDQISDIIGQVAEALDYAHRKGIIHRDIKPANVMITTDGKVKITDFGIAKVASSNLTTTGQFLGTPNYMSPEQVTGAPVDGRSDIFSLSVVLYEMLSRRKPFAGENLTTISYKIVHEAFVPLADISKQVPEEFDAILGRGLSKDPWNRFQRGKDMALALYQAKARFEERAIFQDLGEMVSSAENLPTLKMENASELARSGGSAPSRGESTVAIPLPPAEASAEEVFDEPPTVLAPMPSLEEGVGAATGPADGGADTVVATAPAAGERPALPGKSTGGPKRGFPAKWAAMAAIAAAVAAAVVWVRARPRSTVPPPVSEAGAGAPSDFNREIQKGKALYDRGDYAASLAMFREILQRDPSVNVARDYAQMNEEAIRASDLRKTEQEKATLAAQHVEAARQAIGKKDYEAAIGETDQALELQPGNEEAMRLSEEARQKLSVVKRAELARERRRQRGTARAGQPQSQPAASAAPSPSPVAPPRPTVTANTPATVRITFDSPISRGFLMVAVDEKILFRRNFDFGKDGRGTISDTIHTSPGAATLKVWLTTPDSSVKGYVPIPVTLNPGDDRTLTITVAGGNKLSAHLS